MDNETQINLLDDLQDLLEKQIELVRRGGIRDVEVLSKHASSIVKKIVNAGILESEEFKKRQERLEKLYKNLGLTLAAKKAETTEELNRVCRGKKTITAYRRNI